jgi:hypothetical protein
MKYGLFLGALVTVLVASACAGDKPADVGGWSNTHWGMTEQEVLAALPGQATRLTGPLPERSYAGGVVVNVGIENLDISHTKFLVHFVMDGKGRLRRVLLKPIERAYPFHFQTIEAILTEKYGQPSYKSALNNKLISKWTFASTIIELEFTEYGTIGSVMTVIYDRKSTSDTDKM